MEQKKKYEIRNKGLEEKLYKIIEAIEDVYEMTGIGEVNVRLMEDQRFVVNRVPWVQNPTNAEILDTVERCKGYGFGGLEVKNGKIVLLKKRKTINLT